MGRGKVELKRIENKINRQVTFAKRRNGLLKKSYELSIMCDADIALIIFSNKGKLYEFCSSTSSMAKTLERYHRSNYDAIEAHQLSPSKGKVMSGILKQHGYQEYLKLKARVENLQQSQRHLLGDELGNFCPKELDQLECILDSSLKKIRSKQTQHLFEQLSGLQQKAKNLIEVNMALKRKLEGTNAATPETWQQEESPAPYRPEPAQPESFFEPLECNNISKTRYNSLAPNNVSASTQNANGILLPGWMQ